MQMNRRLGWEAVSSMQMKGRCLHVDELGPLPTRLGAQQVPLRFGQKWHPSPVTPPPWVSTL